MSILESLEKVLLIEIATDPNKKVLDPDEDLLDQGIIDSLGIMKLITFIEETFGIEVADEDVVPENFQTLSIIVKFVEKKMHSK